MLAAPFPELCHANQLLPRYLWGMAASRMLPYACCSLHLHDGLVLSALVMRSQSATHGTTTLGISTCVNSKENPQHMNATNVW